MMTYTFIDDNGTFRTRTPNDSHLYFPLTNKNGTLLGSITPRLGGDIKQDNDTFLTPPASVEDCSNNLLCRRDFFLKLVSKNNRIMRLSESRWYTLEAGLLYHTLITKNKGLHIAILNFIPFDLDVEVMSVTIKNTTNKKVTFIPTSFIPLYGRGEKNVRDHRHVSSLLNRIKLTPYGIIVQPTMLFNEEGHRRNETRYYSLGYAKNAACPIGQYPTLETFCGEEGSLLSPLAVYHDKKPIRKKETQHDGKEVCAALRFKTCSLKKHESIRYILLSGIAKKDADIRRTFKKLNTPKKVDSCLQATKEYWQKTSHRVAFDFPDTQYNGWLRWVSLQPRLRKLFGCSFLPHFDYGKGGRGWRDLWQDALNLLVTEPEKTKQLLMESCKGIRIDGSNATIITKNNGFIADRNAIARVWMDHGVWPYLTLKEYIHRTGDVSILLKYCSYFRDGHLMRSQIVDHTHNGNDVTLKTNDNRTYYGTILEHILVEALVAFFNVGEHNCIRLENADWNDGLDMAKTRGESVAFSAMYAYILEDMCFFLEKLKKKTKTLQVCKELTLLMSFGLRAHAYNSIKKKQALLKQYLNATKYALTGTKRTVRIDQLIRDLKGKGAWLKKNIQKKEWLKCGYFNGYYDNKGKRVEGECNGRKRMMLASQVFAILSGVSRHSQIPVLWRSIKRHLKDTSLGGFRLNTDFKELQMNLGRAFGFSYGDKENGAFFNHMVVLLAFALYERGYKEYAAEAFSSLYQMSKAERARIYPMLPEYFNSQGKGLYYYLTGSASWYIHTLLRQILGIRFSFGDVVICPKLTQQFFFSKPIILELSIHKRKIKIIYKKSGNRRTYTLQYLLLAGKKFTPHNGMIVIPQKTIQKLSKRKTHTITVVGR